MASVWRDRAYTTDEAATLSGLKRGQIDVWVSRLPAELFSEKRGQRRWFSPQDICTLRLAHELERGGMVLLTAVACAYEHLTEPPAADAVLVVNAGAVSAKAGQFISDRDVERLRIDRSKILIPAGALCAAIISSAAALYDTAA